MNGNVLIVDDEQQLRKLLLRLISLEGFIVQEAGDLKSAKSLLERRNVDVVLCDVKLPDGNGIDFVKEVKQKFPLVEVILLTAYGNISDGVQAMKNGAFDYLVKGNENNRIIPLLYQATESAKKAAEAAVRINDKPSQDFSALIGKSAPLQKAIEQARKIATSDAAVLLLGETGTGKEVFANAIHYNSGRKGRAIVAINCSTFSRELLEGELFGHKAGAYTGAHKDKEGLVEVADGGTLFLDEIGELPIELQAKLLRFLESGEFIKVGNNKVSKVNVRLIAATNRNLAEEIAKGQFREDLFYRINVFTIELPPLRNRKEDIPELAHYFLKQFLKTGDKPTPSIRQDALDLLKHYPWKGNIRELKNVMQRAAILSENQEVAPSDLPFDIQSYTSQPSQEFSLAAVEKQHIQKMLAYTNGNKTKTAQLLDIGLATLYRKIEEYHIPGSISK